MLLGMTRSRLLAALEEAGRPMGVRELAASIGLHPNSVREQLQLLIDAGLVVSEVDAAVRSWPARPPLPCPPRLRR